MIARKQVSALIGRQDLLDAFVNPPVKLGHKKLSGLVFGLAALALASVSTYIAVKGPGLAQAKLRMTDLRAATKRPTVEAQPVRIGADGMFEPMAAFPARAPVAQPAKPQTDTQFAKN